MRRASLTVDLDCAVCKGTGRTRVSLRLPGGRIGGTNRPLLWVLQPCDCVQAVPRRDHLRELLYELLHEVGCSCHCPHNSEEHDASCVRCVGCRVEAILGVT